jgi:hypothetical protein
MSVSRRAALTDAAHMNNDYGRLARNLGLAFSIVGAVVLFHIAVAAILVLLAAILYRLDTARA